MEQSIKQKKVFFPNLDGLRFICFLMVFLFHCYKTIFKLIEHDHPSFYRGIKFLFQNGDLGVNFFFVLSGFLITFLIIKEKEYTNTLHLGNFYLRRILRIWPLFYLCLIIGFLLVPFLKSFSGQSSEEIANPLYYIFFINNFDYINKWPLFPDALILIVLWSVAVEEQFYITWPILLKYIKARNFPKLLCLIIAATLLFRSFFTSDTEHDYSIRNFHTLSVIGDMALGGLFAYFTSYDNKFLAYVKTLSKASIVFIYTTSIGLILFHQYLFVHPIAIVFERIIIAGFFGMIILEQNFANSSILKFSRFKILSKAGIYTYGLYCLHFFIISLVQGGFQKTGMSTNTPLAVIIFSTIALIITIISAVITYKIFESPFLRLKNKFAFIVKK